MTTTNPLTPPPPRFDHGQRFNFLLKDSLSSATECSTCQQETLPLNMGNFQQKKKLQCPCIISIMYCPSVTKPGQTINIFIYVSSHLKL